MPDIIFSLHILRVCIFEGSLGAKIPLECVFFLVSSSAVGARYGRADLAYGVIVSASNVT